MAGDLISIKQSESAGEEKETGLCGNKKHMVI